MWLPLSPSSPGLSFSTVKDAKGNAVKHDLKEAMGKLMEYLIKNFDVLKDYLPALILSFDEAHLLAKTERFDRWFMVQIFRTPEGASCHSFISLFLCRPFDDWEI
jgi:hypothetical protein